MPSIAVCSSSATHVWSRRGSGAPGIDVSRHQIIRLGVSSLVFYRVCVQSSGGPELSWWVYNASYRRKLEPGCVRHIRGHQQSMCFAAPRERRHQWNLFTSFYQALDLHHAYRS